MSKVSFIYLSQEEVVKSGGTDMLKTISDVEEVLVMRHKGECIVPHKVVLRKGTQEEESVTGRVNALPGYIGKDKNIGGIKWVASFVQNPFKHGLPRSSSLIIINSFETGIPLAIMDGTIISAMRTGAVAGVACKYLANKDARTVGMVGAGVIGRTVLMAVKAVLKDIVQVQIYDLFMERAEKFAKGMQDELKVPVSAVDSAEKALSNKDIIMTATPAKKPYVKAPWVAGGSLYLHMSGYECEYGVLSQSDKIVVDNWEDVKARNSQTPALMLHDGKLSDGNIHAEIAEIIIGEKPGRENRKERIFFNPVGMGVQNLMVAHRIYRTAKEKGYGQTLTLWDKPMWI
ncbi:MAG: Alanine dehydrogenase [Candidatus Methanolliviera sp. GoM_asphalt]|nr:MAG: Alanine dehydrogenase [Candidatus Methanolliviera sp. GoM_asphalt]